MERDRASGVDREGVFPGSVISILLDEIRACRRERLVLCQDL